MTFTLDQALKAQAALRQASNLKQEDFPLEALIGMLSDEIEIAREKGKSDQEIAELVSHAAGENITAAQIAENYATPEQRQRG